MDLHGVITHDFISIGLLLQKFAHIILKHFLCFCRMRQMALMASWADVILRRHLLSGEKHLLLRLETPSAETKERIGSVRLL